MQTRDKLIERAYTLGELDHDSGKSADWNVHKHQFPSQGLFKVCYQTGYNDARREAENRRSSFGINQSDS